MLGDDLLIVGDDLYKAYENVVNIAKMKLNTTKTFRSMKMYEFAKRFFLNGREITPFPVGAVLTAESSIAAMAVSLDNARAKS
jgi:hypothetical protein